MTPEGWQNFGLGCFFVSLVLFFICIVLKVQVEQYKRKYLRAVKAATDTVGGYFYMWKEAKRVKIKYNILFNNIVTSLFEGSFNDFAKWAKKEDVRLFGNEAIPDLNNVKQYCKEVEDEITKISNE